MDADRQSDELSRRRSALIDTLARRYGGALARYFSRNARHQNDVPDLVQEVLMRLSQVSDRTEIEKPDNYLFRVASSTLTDHARREKRNPPSRFLSLDPEIHGDSDFTPERVLAGRQAIQAMEAAVRALPERTRTVFVLRVLEEQKTADVARLLGISTRAVEAHQAKAMAAVALAVREHRHD